MWISVHNPIDSRTPLIRKVPAIGWRPAEERRRERSFNLS